MRIYLIVFYVFLLLKSSDIGAKPFVASNDSVGKVQILKKDSNIYYFKSGMAIDADGSPGAYCEADTGADYLKNAGYPGHWWGIACDAGGRPYKQKNSDVFPGFYISTTSLVNRNYSDSETLRYANSDSIAYIALPKKIMEKRGIVLGDYAVVIYQGDTACAIVADVGPEGKIGEGSIALARLLGIHSSPKNGGVVESVEYYIFAKSGAGNGIIPEAQTIQNQKKNLQVKINSL